MWKANPEVEKQIDRICRARELKTDKKTLKLE
jgi:hypothetical protein